jgi:hypothetical protein
MVPFVIRRRQPGSSVGAERTDRLADCSLRLTCSLRLARLLAGNQELQPVRGAGSPRIVQSETLPVEGRPTAAEQELGLNCFEYAELTECASFGRTDAVPMNVDKVPLLAERWSLDPARIDERMRTHEPGVVGEPPQGY